MLDIRIELNEIIESINNEDYDNCKFLCNSLIKEIDRIELQKAKKELNKQDKYLLKACNDIVKNSKKRKVLSGCFIDLTNNYQCLCDGYRLVKTQDLPIELSELENHINCDKLLNCDKSILCKKLDLPKIIDEYNKYKSIPKKERPLNFEIKIESIDGSKVAYLDGNLMMDLLIASKDYDIYGSSNNFDRSSFYVKTDNAEIIMLPYRRGE